MFTSLLSLLASRSLFGGKPTPNLTQQIGAAIDGLSTQHSTPPQPPPDNSALTAHDLLLAFKSQPWAEIGYEDGNLYNTVWAYDDKTSAISNQFRAINREVIKEIKVQIYNAEIDLLGTGSNGQLSDIARAKIKVLEQQCQYYQLQIDPQKDYKNDPESECHFIIEQYRLGFNRGHATYLRRSGISK